VNNKNEIELVKMKITQEMVGHTCLIPKSFNVDYYNSIQPGETIFCTYEKLTKNKQRSLEQFGLFWKACDVFANNNEDKSWNTKEKVAAQLKFALKFFDIENIYWFKYESQTGDKKEMLQFPLKSLSFSKSDHFEASAFINEAFEFMSDKWNMQVEEFIEHVKSQMGS
jgi:hypothetical protein